MHNEEPMITLNPADTTVHVNDDTVVVDLIDADTFRALRSELGDDDGGPYSLDTEGRAVYRLYVSGETGKPAGYSVEVVMEPMDLVNDQGITEPAPWSNKAMRLVMSKPAVGFVDHEAPTVFADPVVPSWAPFELVE